MKRYALTYTVTLILFVGIDALWLTAMSDRLYRRYLGEVLAASFNPLPAVLFYLLYVAGIMVFATTPAFATRSRSSHSSCHSAPGVSVRSSALIS